MYELRQDDFFDDPNKKICGSNYEKLWNHGLLPLEVGTAHI